MATQQVDPMQARVAALEAKIEALEARAERPAEPVDEPDRPVSRRRLIGMAGAAAAGAVGATALAATPAAANNGDNVVIGASNTGTLSTGLTSSPAGATFIGSNSGAGQGLRGESATGVGVYATGPAIGVQVESASTGVRSDATDPGGYALHARATSSSGGTPLVAERSSGGQEGSHMWLIPHPNVAGAPTIGNHQVGEIWMDSAGVLFQCVVTGLGPAAKWVRQSPLVTLDSPVRVYYSLTFPDPPLGNGLERSVTVTNGTTIPHTASAVLTNLAVTPAGSDGFLAMFKDGTVWPGTSNVNFTAGQFASNNATSAVAFSAGTGKVKIRCGGASVHFVIDVFGYYP